jgi:hypothetical protein
MSVSGSDEKRRKQGELDLLFTRASKRWDEGKLTSAFRLFLVGAKAGDYGAQLNLGTFYSDGIGVKRNRSQALYWYRRAYRHGDGAAASNIGVVYRDEGNLRSALEWFQRAVKFKDADAHLEIAKIYIQRGETEKALACLKRVRTAKAGYVTEASREEAKRLVEEYQK